MNYWEEPKKTELSVNLGECGEVVFTLEECRERNWDVKSYSDPNYYKPNGKTALRVDLSETKAALLDNTLVVDMPNGYVFEFGVNCGWYALKTCGGKTLFYTEFQEV